MIYYHIVYNHKDIVSSLQLCKVTMRCPCGTWRRETGSSRCGQAPPRLFQRCRYVVTSITKPIQRPSPDLICICHVLQPSPHSVNGIYCSPADGNPLLLTAGSDMRIRCALFANHSTVGSFSMKNSKYYLFTGFGIWPTPRDLTLWPVVRMTLFIVLLCSTTARSSRGQK